LYNVHGLLKLTIHGHEASRGLSAIAELLVLRYFVPSTLNWRCDYSVLHLISTFR